MAILSFVTHTVSAERNYDEIAAFDYVVVGRGAAGAVFAARLRAPHATLAAAAFIRVWPRLHVEKQRVHAELPNDGVRDR
jgi:hypothetical protein